MDAATWGPEQELESLIQFLYLAPIGIVQASMDGEILLLNPMSAQLLLPLAHGAELTNLFDALAVLEPGLRDRARDYALPHGRVCDNVQLQVAPAADGRNGPEVLSLTLLKLDETRLMAVLSDVSVAIRRESALRQSRTWITTILAGRGDYALMTLDREGDIRSWNPGVGAVTGFAQDQTLGRTCAIFAADGKSVAEDVPARLDAARQDGWHLEDRWCRRADGSLYWGSGLLVPIEPVEPGDGAPAFSFVLRCSPVAPDTAGPTAA